MMKIFRFKKMTPGILKSKCPKMLPNLNVLYEILLRMLQ